MIVGLKLVQADVDKPTKFTNQGGIGNTRHNLTQRQSSGGGPAGVTMDQYRNDYGEICVYCHAPHGASEVTALPLWNRTLKATVYTTYNQLGTQSLTQTVTQPGAASLSCLSCHDGQTAVDSIINMPGSGRYLKSQETAPAQNTAFLNTWRNSSGVGPSVHIGLSSNISTGCLACHSPEAGFVGAGATDFTVFSIGTDLKNDHPVGITYPATNGPGTDFQKPARTKGSITFFDTNNDSNLGTDEVRIYGGMVECASCHDPHGVPSAGPGSVFKPTFLRVTNTGSALCLSCHNK